MQSTLFSQLPAFRLTVTCPGNSCFDINVKMSDLNTSGKFITSKSLIEVIVRGRPDLADQDVFFFNDQKLDASETNIKVADLLEGILSIRLFDEPEPIYDDLSQEVHLPEVISLDEAGQITGYFARQLVKLLGENL